MWSVLKRPDRECRRVRDSLEEVATQHPESASVSHWIKGLAAEKQRHMEACGACREAAEELAATRELFRGAASFAEEERPWFAAGVMGAIALRERELALRLNAWNEFPRFAARLAWIAGVLLLAGTTWFYERVLRTPQYQLNGASQESIFEAPQQTSQDDALISMTGDNP